MARDRLLGAIAAIGLCFFWESVSAADYRVVQSFPHDQTAYTQGLTFDGDVLYESTGLWGKSTLRRVDVTTGVVEQRVDVHPLFFAEELAVVGERLIQLTWQSRRGIIYDKHTLEAVDSFSYASEGWGLTFDGTHLVMSDGSHQLYFLDVDDFAVQRVIEVKEGSLPISRLNELEFFDGHLLANVWQTTDIVRIDPDTGAVVRRYDLSALAESQRRENSAAEVLNGIAYHEASERLFVTGKYWNRLYVIELENE